jgi:hypothetical protein
MDDLSGIAVFTLSLFIVSVFCSVFYLVITFTAKEKYIDRTAHIRRILRGIFIKTNLPLGILATILNVYAAYDILVRYNDIDAGFLLCCIFFVLSFIIERVIDKISPENSTYTLFSVPEKLNSLGIVIELINETAAQKSLMLSTISGHNSTLLADVKTTQDNLNTTARILKEYTQDEKQKSKGLADKIKICADVFEKFIHSTDLALEKSKSLKMKLTYSCTALAISENQETLLADMNTNFVQILNERSVEFNKKIQRILDRLSDIAYKCSWFQNFPRPYKDMIALYSVRIEAVLRVLDSRKNNLLWNEHIETGKAGVFNAPDQAIVELNEAIRIKPEHDEAYYWRGIAYQIKKPPNYNASLLDFEKAFSLKPYSTRYLKSIEDVKLKMNVGVQET